MDLDLSDAELADPVSKNMECAGMKRAKGDVSGGLEVRERPPHGSTIDVPSVDKPRRPENPLWTDHSS
jgi:hypothetical protein